MATIGLGSKVQVDDGASNAFVDFDEVTNITVPMQELATVESTHLGISNRMRTYVAGLIEPGLMSFEQNWSDAAYDRALDLRGVTKNYKVIFPDTSTAAFAGILQKAEIDVQVDQIIKIKNEVKVTGSVTFTPAE